MDFDTFYAYCMAKPGTEETFPFGEQTLVFKVKGKMYALVGLDRTPLTTNLKCDPERALELREQHEEIVAGWHMNKHHWNTVTLDGELSGQLILELIDHSYELVVKSLPKKVRLALTEETQS
ncbi:MAG: MmcQ/YjbR family DNA-binding protein [Bacteroidota bacterium]